MRLNTERQNNLEPVRLEYAIRHITDLGLPIISQDNKKVEFAFKGHTVFFYAYSGWFTGKTVKDGRGIRNLIKQLKSE